MIHNARIESIRRASAAAIEAFGDEGPIGDIAFLLARLDELMEASRGAAETTEANYDKIAALCGCPQWEYPGQVVRDVELLKKRAEAAERERGLVASLADRCEHIADDWAGEDCDGGDIDRTHTTGIGYRAATACAEMIRIALKEADDAG